MRISVIGTGYVGLVTGACLAGYGNHVTCVDVDQEKIASLNQDRVPFFEPGLEEIIKSNRTAGRLHFTTSLEEGIKGSKVCFITVGTPSDVDGSADLQYVLQVAREIGRHMEDPMVVVTKSTVPVGTADKVRSAVAEELKARGGQINFFVASNPEFLREGAAVSDFMNPDRVVIGTDSKEAEEILKELYSFLPPEKVLCMDIRSSEMTKYAANALLATKISFMNEMARICELVGADVERVRLGIGSDSRIGYAFISPGCGYGGSCFPKDVRALRHTALRHGYSPRILQAVEDVNEAQKHLIFQKVLRHFGQDISGLTFAIWGLSFKPNTSDMREASSLVLIQDLLGAGASVRVHDPKAMEEAKHILAGRNGVTFVEDQYEALKGTSALALVTEWDMYKQPDFQRIKEEMLSPVIFDGRNQYSPNEMRRLGFTYYGIGRPNA
ncbi:nucleotide sugar dehydrogenase [Thermanaerovibrio velox DSM 12556]|uniref:UDP-glucose 6-dehydrogenase n=1 Tax=Thermanaerovibrio velox DSM 12556 TaxID=926567 RepID=H0UPS2_9BACT|nr:UDP-glucose/GDP-mannose dehydrogenase family protein [Thermanaerovibrio velox]EHM10631.1 nucleotide sugar dehydrogenase [Thermanaerovibrio velox DSM 12556]